MDENEILEIAQKNNGYLYKDLVKKNNIAYTTISKMAKKGLLTKVASGIYITSSGVEDEFFINSIRFSNLVYSGETAIFLNGLSNKQFPELEAVVPYGTTVPKIEGYKVRQSRRKNVGLGVSFVETPFGNKVKCYDKERCICELIANPDHYDFEDRVYAIREYNQFYLNFEKLYSYAAELNVLEKVKNVFEVIGWN